MARSHFFMECIVDRWSVHTETRRSTEARRFGFWVTEGTEKGLPHEALYAVLENRNVKVDPKAFSKARQLHVRKNLAVMDRQDLLDRLQFDDQLGFDNEISSKGLREFQAIVGDGHPDLLPKLE